eukprot:11609923-Ditylum_brightwellii.AAC.1
MTAALAEFRNSEIRMRDVTMTSYDEVIVVRRIGVWSTMTKSSILHTHCSFSSLFPGLPWALITKKALQVGRSGYQ